MLALVALVALWLVGTVLVVIYSIFGSVPDI
jgi:hypothetical protein